MEYIEVKIHHKAIVRYERRGLEMEFVKLSEHAFDEYSRQSEYQNIWQSVPMNKLREQRGWEVHYVGVKEEDEIVCASALVSYSVAGKYKLFQALRGFLIDYHDQELLTFFHEQIVKYIKSCNGIHFSFDPYVMHKQRDIHGEYVEGGINNEDVVTLLKKLGYKHTKNDKEINEEVAEPEWLFVLPVKDKSEKELLQDMTQMTRRCINKTEKKGFYAKELDRSSLDKFKDIIDTTAKRRHFTNRPLEYYEMMYDVFHEKGMIKFLVIGMNVDEYMEDAKLNLEKELEKKENIKDTSTKKSMNKLNAIQEKINSLEKKLKEANTLKEQYGNDFLLSGAMFLLNEKEVIYLNGGSYEEFMQFSAQYRLQWEMIKYAAQHHMDVYNFYGISPDFSENSPEKGIYEFKKGFHGEVRELIGTFDLTINPLMYAAYTKGSALKKKIRNR